MSYVDYLENVGGHEVMISAILSQTFGNEVWDDSAGQTAERILRFWKEYAPEPMDIKLTTFPAKVQQLILVRDIEFSSLCAHHLLPFYGKAHVGYLPHELQIGLSKIPRVVQHFAKRPQVQENLTAEIADFLKPLLKAKALGVVIEAVHTCMACRGVRAMGASMVTSEMRGTFLTSDRSRSEFMEMIR